MAGVGEASAIVALIGTAATLSKAVFDIASKYKNARKQIESFGTEVSILGNVLDQLHRLQEKDHMEADDGIQSVIMTTLGQCAELFSELETYKDALYSRPGSVRNLTFRGKAKWVFTAAELDYLRARLESVKTNILLMMTMQCSSRDDRTIQELSIQSDGWAKRLETLEKKMMIPNDSSNDPAVNRMSIRVVDTANSVRSTRDSILSLYGHRSYYDKILDPREGPFAMALEIQADYSRVSRIIEDHLEDDLLPVEAAPNAVNTALDVQASASMKSYDSLIDPQFGGEVSWFPFSAIAVVAYKAKSAVSHRLSFEKNEVLQVATFSGTIWLVRKATGEQGLADSQMLRPYYPYSARVRFNFTGGPFALENEIVDVSAKVKLDTSGFSYWRPWRRKTGETGIAPDASFDCIDKPLPLPEYSPFPHVMQEWGDDYDYSRKPDDHFSRVWI